MKIYSPKEFFRGRQKTYSALWFEIFETRLLLCLVVIVFAFTHPGTGILLPVIVAVIVYSACNAALGLLDARTLELKEMKTFPEVADIVFVSFLIYYGGGPQSSWFLLYLFPALSAFRYLGRFGCLALAILAAAAYTSLNYLAPQDQSLDTYSFALRVLAMLGIVLVVSNLVTTKYQEDHRLTRVFEEVDHAILSDEAADKVLSLILEKAIEFTHSEMGQMILLTGESKLVTAIGQSRTYHGWIAPITESYSQKLIESKKPFIITTLSKSRLRREVGKSFSSYESILGSALFVRLSLDDNVIGVLAVYSQKRLHYTDKEATRLGGFASLVARAQKNARLYKEITSAAQESKDRLRMLHEITERLRAEQRLSDLFAEVVELIYSRLNSEEAALFIPSIEDAEQIEKVAVKGPNHKITRRLGSVEKYYRSGKSLAGGIFKSKQPQVSNDISSDVEYVKDYSEILPSGKTRHYIGMPLVIGDEVLGVIRVINKRAKNYSMGDKNYELSEKGFDKDDVELMQTIATQVASAIRNANLIATHSYFHYLVENSPDPIIVLDKNGRIKVFNEACEQIWGYSADEVKGKSVEDYYESPEHAQSIGKDLWNSKDYKIQDYQARIKKADGSIITINLSARLLFEKDKTPASRGKQKDRNTNREGERLIGSIGVFKDLMEIKRQHENETFAAVGKLTSRLIHDIKTDIATIQTYINVLMLGAMTKPEMLRPYKGINEAAKRVLEKLQQKVRAPNAKPVKTAVTVKDLFNGIDEAMLQQANSKRVEFLINHLGNNSQLMADKDQIRQVLTNLFLNSLDAIDEKQKQMNAAEKGQIEVLTRINKDKLELSWKDNGCGIPKQKMSDLFSPYSTSKETGSGLGLFIVKSIIGNHGGGINVNSVEGKGTTFTINLPILKETASIENK